MVANEFVELMASLPPRMEPEFLMTTHDEPISLANGTFDLLRDGVLLGHLHGQLTLTWVPQLRIQCKGTCNIELSQLWGDQPLTLRVPEIGLEAEAYLTGGDIIGRSPIQLQVRGSRNPNIPACSGFYFYLVNFPEFLGEAVRTQVGTRLGFSKDRLTMTAGDLICTVDRIGSEVRQDPEDQPGYLLTHIGEVRRSGRALEANEVQILSDVLYWLFAFIRGARSGPVLPSLERPFAQSWISIAPWIIDEPRRVNTWLPDRTPLDMSGLLEGFLRKWEDPTWNDGLRTTLAWYTTANAPRTPNEARIPLCQIALELLASLEGLEMEPAHARIDALLGRLGIPRAVPERLSALAGYAGDNGIGAAECLTRVRNKLEHPTSKNRAALKLIDGVIRMEAAQYGIELFELSLLAILGYRGHYAMRAFRGWKGNDEVKVPWATVSP